MRLHENEEPGLRARGEDANRRGFRDWGAVVAIVIGMRGIGIEGRIGWDEMR